MTPTLADGIQALGHRDHLSKSTGPVGLEDLHVKDDRGQLQKLGRSCQLVYVSTALHVDRVGLWLLDWEGLSMLEAIKTTLVRFTRTSHHLPHGSDSFADEIIRHCSADQKAPCVVERGHRVM